MGALIEIGALIYENTFEGWCLFERGRLRDGRRALNRVITVHLEKPSERSIVLNYSAFT